MRDASGQMYMRNRYYHPHTGQFTQMAPIGLAGGLNSYGFAAGDPVTYSDPYGLCAETGADTIPEPGMCRLPIPQGGVADVSLDLALIFAPIGRTGQAARPLLGRLAGGLRNLLGRRTAEQAARFSGMLRSAARGKGNFGIGRATAQEADDLGRAWVGEGFTTASNGTILISRDGLRQYRPPSYKPAQGRRQANLEARQRPGGEWQHNAHIDIVP